MTQAYSIWAPVVIGRLKSPRCITGERIYAIEDIYKASEDVKVKVKNCRVEPQGRLIEVRLKVEVLCLMEDLSGSMHLIIKEEMLKEKVPLSDFDSFIEKGSDIKYITNILKVNAYASLEEKSLQVAIFIDVAIMAACEQVINLSLAEEVAPVFDLLPDVLAELKAEIKQMASEKEELKRQVFFYERDIISLKKGLKKAENKNASLNKEIEAYHNAVEQLKGALQDKEWRLNRYENVYYNYSYDDTSKDEDDMAHNLGSRIKRMFMSN